MSLVDTLDSILMLYAYAQPDLRSGPGRKLALFVREKNLTLPAYSGEVDQEPVLSSSEPAVARISSRDSDPDAKPVLLSSPAQLEAPVDSAKIDTVDPRDERTARVLAAKTATMSSLSISLTLLSILVALSISLIEIIGLIGENCGPCVEAAEAPDGGGLAGSWWRAWARANEASGYVGAAIGESGSRKLGEELRTGDESREGSSERRRHG